ncbi:hypothetical protein [Nitrosopumilus sp.]|uniref:hypothetical protein n=1 Tax=Nitrosopumilus sp. TaxID=2024843 RepID=UPI00292F6E4B|nr:hypothetical protein [Nitrosopumilus sp.]
MKTGVKSVVYVVVSIVVVFGIVSVLEQQPNRIKQNNNPRILQKKNNHHKIYKTCLHSPPPFNLPLKQMMNSVILHILTYVYQVGLRIWIVMNPTPNFNVLYPDQHKFDSDKDGIGCEK